MRAVVVTYFTLAEHVTIDDVSEPVVESGSVIVNVEAAALGFVDNLKTEGRYQTKDPLPFIPGMEFSGIVAAIGDGVRNVRPGDRVFGQAPRGGLAERICVPAGSLWRLPEHMSFAQGAAVPVNYLTAIYALQHRARVRPGEVILILGAAGGTGTAALKVGKMLGATMVAAASTEQKRSFAHAEGAGIVVDHSRSHWRDELKELLGGRNIDVIYDVVGGDISPIAFRSLAWNGRHLVVGFAAGSIPALPFNIALLKGASLIGVDSAQIASFEPDIYAQIMSDIEIRLQTGLLEPPPVEVFAFEDFRSAFRAMKSRTAMGKIVVCHSPSSRSAHASK